MVRVSQRMKTFEKSVFGSRNEDVWCDQFAAPSEVFVHGFILQRLNLQLDGTLVEVRQQRLRVTDQEVELLRRQLLQHQGAHHEHVPAPLDHDLVGQAAVERPEHETPDEDVLQGSFSCSVFTFEVT